MIFIKTQNNGALVNINNCKIISLGENENNIVIVGDEYILGTYKNINDATMILNWIMDAISQHKNTEDVILCMPTIEMIKEDNKNAENN